MEARPKTIGEYLAGVSPAHRAALETVHKTVKGLVPEAEECISYGMAAFKWDGMLVAFGAREKHCAPYPWNSTTVAEFNRTLGS